MGKLRYGSGIATIEMDDTMDRLVRRAIEVSQPGLVRRLEETAQRIHAETVARWPVRTGRSKAGLDWYMAIKEGGTEIRAVISTGGVPYTFYVRPLSLYGGNTGWSEWVQRPMREAGAKLAIELGPIIARQLTGEER